MNINPQWLFCRAQHMDQRTKDVIVGFNKNILTTKEVPAIVNCICLCYFYEEKLQKVKVQTKHNYAKYTKTNEKCNVLNQVNNYNGITEASGLYEINCDKIKHHIIEENNDNKNKNNKSEPKCIVIRDINITNSSINKHISKPWFLVIGTKRKALFITSTISIRNKWYNFICESLGKKHITHHDKAQSTIPLDLFNSKHMREISEFQYKTIKFNYPSRITDCNIINNGHTIQININSNKCQLITDNNKIFQLKQFHFHITSEHYIRGKKYEMEMHLTHMNVKTNKIIILCFIFTNKQNDKNWEIRGKDWIDYMAIWSDENNLFLISITNGITLSKNQQ